MPELHEVDRWLSNSTGHLPLPYMTKHPKNGLGTIVLWAIVATPLKVLLAGSQRHTSTGLRATRKRISSLDCHVIHTRPSGNLVNVCFFRTCNGPRYRRRQP